MKPNTHNFILAFILFFPIASFSQKSHDILIDRKAGYEITGHLPGLKEGEKVLLILSASKGYHSFNNFLSVQDSAYVQNSKFRMKGYVPEGPRRYLMTFDKHNGTEGPLKIIDFCIDNNETITIKCDSNIDKIPHSYIEHYVSVNGSPTNYSRLILEPARVLYDQTVNQLQTTIGRVYDSLGFDGPRLDGIFAAKHAIDQCFYWNIMRQGSQLDPEVVKSNLTLVMEYEASRHASYWMDVYNDLEEDKRSSFFGKWVRDVAILSIGQPFPDFTLVSSDEKKLNLKEIVRNGKATIVHFWSANSQNRKVYQAELQALYKKYHGKGLNVVGLFHDDSYDKRDAYTQINLKQQWKDIITNEKLAWLNVADLRGSESFVEKVCREGGINNTTNVILDGEGKIIAWDARGVNLQYYLWKVFGN